MLDVDVQTGLARLDARPDTDRFEREQKAFFEAVRAMYRQRAQQNPQRFRVIDASQALDAVQQDIVAVLGDFLGKSRD